jgi:hypothetical protein
VREIATLSRAEERDNSRKLPAAAAIRRHQTRCVGRATGGML